MYEELIRRLHEEPLDSNKAALPIMDLCIDAATAIENLSHRLDMAISALRQQDVADKDVGKNEPLTNAQKIRSMSDEELSEFLIDLADDGNLRIRDWLQQPAEEDENGV